METLALLIVGAILFWIAQTLFTDPDPPRRRRR